MFLLLRSVYHWDFIHTMLVVPTVTVIIPSQHILYRQRNKYISASVNLSIYLSIYPVFLKRCLFIIYCRRRKNSLLNPLWTIAHDNTTWCIFLEATCCQRRIKLYNNTMKRKETSRWWRTKSFCTRCRIPDYFNNKSKSCILFYAHFISNYLSAFEMRRRC